MLVTADYTMVSTVGTPGGVTFTVAPALSGTTLTMTIPNSNNQGYRVEGIVNIQLLTFPLTHQTDGYYWNYDVVSPTWTLVSFDPSKVNITQDTYAYTVVADIADWTADSQAALAYAIAHFNQSVSYTAKHYTKKSFNRSYYWTASRHCWRGHNKSIFKSQHEL